MLERRQPWSKGGSLPENGYLWTLLAGGEGSQGSGEAWVNGCFETVEMAPGLVARAGWPGAFALELHTINVPFARLGTAGSYTFLTRGALGMHEQAAKQFAETVHGLDETAGVYARLSGDTLDLWTVLRERTGALEKAIADKACDLMRSYSYLLFDFMVVDGKSEAAETLAQSGYIAVTCDERALAPHAIEDTSH